MNKASSQIRAPDSTETFINEDDEQLMLRYANGDTQAFNLLYARYEQALYRYAYNGCHNEATAGELFQEIWLRVIRARESFKPAQPFKAWLFSIARNLLIDSCRRQSSSALDQRTGHELDDNPDTVRHDSMRTSQDAWARVPLTPDQIASATQQSDTLRDALQCLPVTQREAILLKHIAGFNISEIAHIQEQPAQTVKSRLRYAMVKLRQHLKESS